MKIRSELKAGRTFEDCAKERDWWKTQAGLMEQYANSKKNNPPAGLWLPTVAVQPPSGHPTGSGTYHPDMSGICG